MSIAYDELAKEPRLLMQVDLTPLQGKRFQPTGFPDLGPARYTDPDGVETLLVESPQSVANRMELACWDAAVQDLIEKLRGLPFIKVIDDSRKHLSNSLLEAHRINSEYIMKNAHRVTDNNGELEVASDTFNKEFADEIEYDKAGRVNWQKFRESLFKYDPNCLVHGVFLEEIGGRLRVTRALSGFIEANGVGVAESGGVKNNIVEPGQTGGEGNVPYHRTEFTAKQTTAFFNLDLSLLRSYGLGDVATKLLIALSLFKIRRFLSTGLRLRTACDLEAVGELTITRPKDGVSLPSESELLTECESQITACREAKLFADPHVTERPLEEVGSATMIAIGLRFPAGRFHTTPWGRHVNEGAPEWPPSPWRLLRALVAVWKGKLVSLDEQCVRDILESIADPPLFSLPDATVGHSRHYMPWYKSGGQTLVFDAFVSLKRDSEVVAIWPDATLSPVAQSALASLLEHLNYFGRAESWCDARLIDREAANEHLSQVNCRPLSGDAPADNNEYVRLICADPIEAFGSEHVTIRKTVGKGKAETTVEEPKYDPNWHLCIETAQLHAERWSDPPGSKWVTYSRPVDCFNPPPRPRPRTRTRPRIQVARYVLDAPVLPLVTETLPLAERARIAMMGRYKLEKLSQTLGRPIRSNAEIPPDAPRVRSEAISGKDAGGTPLNGHQHAFYLPTDEDHDGRIDHLTIVAEMGFDQIEVKTLDQLRSLRYGDGDPLRLLLVGLGQMKELRAPPFAESNVWVSATPFLVTRHPKKNGRRRDPPELLTCPVSFVEAVLCEELARWIARRPDLEGLSTKDINVEPIVDAHHVFRVPKDPRFLRRLDAPTSGSERAAFDAGSRSCRPIQFKRFRSKRSDDGGRRRAGAFRITFAQPVSGPICLGHSSHFGLGLFLPETSCD